jgi:type I restriction enzyme S subunit
MEEWKEYKLEEIGTIVGGATPSTKEPHNYDGNISWITPKDLSNNSGRYISRGERMITSEGYNSCSCKMLPKGSVLFSSRAPIGYVAIASNELCTNQGFKSIIPDEQFVDSTFLYYLLVYNKVLIEGLGSGTTFKEVSGNVMKNVVVKIPCLEIQRQIASVLSSLDDKIEVNRRINDNLEQQAQALFKSWFVDFEPFKDSEFVESELGMIPKGWKVDSLSSIADYINGLAMQKYRPTEGEVGLPVLKIKELGQGNTDDSSELCSPSLIGEKYIIDDGDIIFSWSGTLMVKVWCGGKCGLNQHLFVVEPKDYPHWFAYQWTKHHLDNFIHIAKDKAVTMGHIKRGELDKAKVVVPDGTSMAAIDSMMKPLHSQIIANRIESRLLAELRDTLLPRLMSGEIKVGDVTL